MIVIGSGVIGVTTAYALRGRGHDVIVVDRCDGPGRETSFANGAMLTASMSEPWNAPGSWWSLLASFGNANAAMQLRLRALPGLVGWGIRFLRSSSARAYRRSARANLALALLSLQATRTMRTDAALDDQWAARGTLRVFRDARTLERAVAAAATRRADGLAFCALTPSEAVAFEPGLAPIGDRLAGAIHYPIDEVGDAHRFCVALERQATARGVQFHYATSVRGVEAREGRFVAVETARGRIEGDSVVVAAGSDSPLLLRPLGIDVPVRPVKGYSLTFADDPEAPQLRVPVIDDALHAAVVPLDGAIRVAGTAEFAGYDRSLRPDRIDNLVRLLREILPTSKANLRAATAWCGLRPMSADGVPIIGATPVRNLFVNTGHGPLGWTMAAGSAELLAAILTREVPEINPAPYTLARFA